MMSTCGTVYGIKPPSNKADDMSTQAHPLQWPEGQARTKFREPSRFKTTFAVARDELASELERLGAKLPVLSTNVEIRLDGLPYANRPEPADPAVAVYFQWRDRHMCFACDKWDRVKDNIQAVRKTIEALRGIERWGSGDMMAAAFSGFEALPSPNQIDHWRSILDCPNTNDLTIIKDSYRRLVSITHPDKGSGNNRQFQRVNEAWRQAQQELVA